MKNPKFERLSPNEAKALSSKIYVQRDNGTVYVTLYCGNSHVELSSKKYITAHFIKEYSRNIPVGIESDDKLDYFWCDGYGPSSNTTQINYTPEPIIDSSGTEGSGTFFDLGDDVSSEDIKLL